MTISITTGFKLVVPPLATLFNNEDPFCIFLIKLKMTGQCDLELYKLRYVPILQIHIIVIYISNP